MSLDAGWAPVEGLVFGGWRARSGVAFHPGSVNGVPTNGVPRIDQNDQCINNEKRKFDVARSFTVMSATHFLIACHFVEYFIRSYLY